MNFSTEILIDVAKNLRDQGTEIVYWQGYRDDFDALAQTKAGFEKTIFRHMFDANKNIPPQGVDASSFEPVGKEIIERMYPYGWQALSMIARADYTNPPFVKRRRVYYEYLKFWHGMLQALKPDAVIFVSVPHSASSFVLYGLAKCLKIKTLMMGRSSIESRMLVFSDYTLGSEELREEYARIKNTAHSFENLGEDIREHYAEVRQEVPPAPGEKRYKHLATRHNRMPFRIPSPAAIIRHLFRFTFLKMLKSYIRMLFSTRKMHYYERDFTGLRMMLLTRRWSRAHKAFKKEYRALQTEPDYRKKYIYVPLAFQPEQTTCPGGDVFDDQLLMIDMVASSVPDGWMVYVKEHLPQWFSHRTETHLYRYPGYYQAIANKKNVQLIPAETHPYELIKNAQAVATVSGTTGWEALVRNIPALVFGYVWYMHCDGVFRISNLSECRSALRSIAEGYAVSGQKVVSYLAALDKVSVKAKHYKTRRYIKNKEASKEENIRNITRALHHAIIGAR